MVVRWPEFRSGHRLFSTESTTGRTKDEMHGGDEEKDFSTSSLTHLQLQWLIRHCLVATHFEFVLIFRRSDRVLFATVDEQPKASPRGNRVQSWLWKSGADKRHRLRAESSTH